jgi:hypothetical protein
MAWFGFVKRPKIYSKGNVQGLIYERNSILYWSGGNCERHWVLEIKYEKRGWRCYE